MARSVTRVLLLALTLVLIAASPAAAMTRSQATKRALAVLKPQAQATNQARHVIVFALPKPLGPRDIVSQAGRPVTKDEKRGAKVKTVGDRVVITRKVKRLGRKAWLFWEDLEYEAGFLHASKVLVLDDKTGKVLVQKDLSVWPTVNGKEPAFIKSRGPGDAKYRVYEQKIPSQAARHTRPVARSSANELVPNGLAGECVIVLNDDKLVDGADKFAKFFKDRGATVYRKSDVPVREGVKGNPDGSDLSTFVRSIAGRCPDVIIYLAGHGGDSNNPTVTLGQHTTQNADGTETEEDADVSGGTIRAIIAQNKNTKIKLVVDSCRAGRFATIPGLAAVVTATGISDASMALPVEKTSVALFSKAGDFTLEFVDQMEKHEGEASRDTSGADKGARVIDQAGATTDNFGRYHRLGLSHVQHRSMLPPIALPLTSCGAGQTCTQDGIGCVSGATCTGNAVVCHDPATTCGPGSGDKCDSGAKCTGPQAQCAGPSTQCTQPDAACTDGASCPAPPPPAMNCTGTREAFNPNKGWSFDIKCDQPWMYVKFSAGSGNNATNSCCQASGWNPGMLSAESVIFTRTSDAAPVNTNQPFGIDWTSDVPSPTAVVSANADGSSPVTVSFP